MSAMRYMLQTLEGNLNSDSPTPRQWAPWEFGVIALLGAAVIAVSWPWMTRIGLYYDEAWSLPAAVRIALGSPQEISFPDGLYLFGRPFPFMVGAYIGPLDAYLYGLVFAIFGVNLLAFRFVNLAVSFVVVAVTYSLTRQMSGRLTAAIAALFLVLDVEFLLRAPTNNVGPILLQILASAAAVMFLMRTTEHRSSQRPAAALFCLGLGISEKLTFLLFLPSLLIAALLFYRRAILDRINPRICIIATAAFLMGCLPIVLHFGGNPNAAFRLTHTYSHSPNADTLQERSEQFKTLITGQWSINYIAGQVAEPGFWRFRSSMPLDGKIGRFSVVWWLFLLSLTLGALALARRLVQRAPLSAEARLCGFLSALCLGVVGCSAFVGEGGKTHHLMLVFPFIHCLAAITLVRAWEVGRGSAGCRPRGCRTCVARLSDCHRGFHSAEHAVAQQTCQSNGGDRGLRIGDLRAGCLDSATSRVSLFLCDMGPLPTGVHSYCGQMPLHRAVGCVGPREATSGRVLGKTVVSARRGLRIW